MGRAEEIHYYRLRMRSLIEEHRSLRRSGQISTTNKQRFQGIKSEIQSKLEVVRAEKQICRSSVRNKAWKISSRCAGTGLERCDCKCRSCPKLREDFENLKNEHLILEELSKLLEAIITYNQIIIDECQ